MKNILTLNLLRVSVCLMLTCYGFFTQADDSLTDKSNELEQLNLKITQLQTNLSKARNKQSQLNRELAETETTLGQLNKDLDNTQKALTAKNETLDQLKQSIITQEDKLTEQRELLAQQVKLTYQLGGYNSVKILFNQSEPATLSRLLTYYGYINKAQSQFINNIRITLNNLSEDRAELTKQTQQLSVLIEENENQQQQIAINQQYRKVIIGQINQEINSTNKQLQTLTANKKELENVIKRLSRRTIVNQQAQVPFNTMHNQLPWPIETEMTKDYNSNYVMQNGGVFIHVAENTPVYAIFPGRVRFANWLRGYGLLIILDHGDNYMSIYSHNQSLYANVGDEINAGDLIGRVGNSGGNQEYGLYFEIRQKGKILDVKQWLE